MEKMEREAYIDGTKDGGVLSGRLARTVVEQVAFRDNDADVRTEIWTEQTRSVG